MPSTNPQPRYAADVSPALREAVASPGQPRKFEALDLADPRFVASLRLLEATKAKTEVVQVGEYSSVLLNAAGQVIRGEERISTEQRPEDVVDVVAFYKDGEKYYIAVSEIARPAVFGRSERELEHVVEQDTGRMVNLPGGYFTEAGPKSSARSVVAQKIGARMLSDPFRLGGSIIPNAGSSPEVAYPYAVEVERPEHPVLVSYGDKLEGTRVVRFMELQEIVNEYHAGRLHDPRLLEATYRLAERMGQKLELPCKAVFVDTPDCQEVSQLVEQRLLTPKSARDLMQDPSSNLAIVAAVQMTEVQEPSEDPFLEPYRLTVQNVGRDGQPLGDPFVIDSVVRRFDTLNVGCFSLVSGEPLLAINIGAREAMELRARAIRIMSSAWDARTTEGVTGSRGKKAPAGEDLRAATLTIAKGHTGIEAFGSPIVLDTYGFWSPGFNTSLYRESLLSFDASQVTKVRDTCYFMRARDILTLADQGVVRDLPLIQMARRLDAAFPSKIEPEVLDFPRRVIDFLDYVGSRDQKLARISREYAPELREEMKVQPLLTTMLARRLGMRASTVELGSREEVFFDSHMETYLFHPEMSGTEAIAFMEHDSWHYEHPDKLPFYAGPDGNLIHGSDGKPLVCSPSEYGVSPSFNEIDALMYSEVIVPDIYGIDAFEAKAGIKTVASLLRESEILDIEEQHAAVQAMAAQGEIPERVVGYLAKGSNFKIYENVLRERLVGFYVRDVLINIPAMYKAWTELPEVAELAIKMDAPAFNDARVIPEKYADRLQAMMQGPRSVNQLQDEIEDTRKNDLYLPILNIAALGNLIDKHAEPAYRDELRAEMKVVISKLFAAQETLKQLLPTIKDTERSHRNLTACATLLEIREGVCREGALFFERLVRDESAIGADNVRELAGRKYVAFPLVSFGVPQGGQAKVSELVSKAFTALDFPDPLA